MTEPIETSEHVGDTGPGFSIRRPGPGEPVSASIFEWNAGVEAALANNGVTHLEISGSKATDLRFLAAAKGIRHLTLSENPSLKSLAGVEQLALTGLRIVYNRKLTSLRAVNGHPTLEFLSISGSRKSEDFQEIDDLPALKTLFLQSGPSLQSFEQVRKMKRLQALVLQSTDVSADAYSVKPLVGLPLTSFRLHPGPSAGFRGLMDVELLGKVISLESLEIGKGPSLASLEFLRPLTQLQKFKLTSTEIVDGDLRVLLELPRLHYLVIHPKKKRYQPSGESLEALVSSRPQPMVT